MVTKQSNKDKSEKKDKPKAARLDITTLVVDNAFEKTFTSGKQGFFGKATDPRTGNRYQIIGAVRLS